MTQTTDPSLQFAGPLPDTFSSSLTALFAKARPGIVQIRNEQRGGGTGVVWKQDGRILTNNHVVPNDQDRIQVHFSDGRTVKAQVVQRNPRLDLALLKSEVEDAHALTLGDSAQLRVGEWVFAIGHPWGQRWAVTAGIVSTISTIKIAPDQTTQYIKSDVRLAPGNSGGPLLDADGNVIGINAMILGGDLSVAIPSNVVNAWLANLPKGRKMLGVELQTVEVGAGLRARGQRASGLLVVSTKARPDSYTDLLIGDILLDVGGTPVNDVPTLRAVLGKREENGKVPITLIRGGKVMTVEIAVLNVEDAA